MDRFDCTVSIPIKFENGNIICAEGYPIPILSESVSHLLFFPLVHFLCHDKSKIIVSKQG